MTNTTVTSPRTSTCAHCGLPIVYVVRSTSGLWYHSESGGRMCRGLDLEAAPPWSYYSRSALKTPEVDPTERAVIRPMAEVTVVDENTHVSAHIRGNLIVLELGETTVVLPRMEWSRVYRTLEQVVRDSGKGGS